MTATMDKSKKLELRNIVATGNLYEPVDTMGLIGKFPVVEKAKIKSKRVIVRLIELAEYGNEYKSSFTLFESGKMNYLGAKSIEALIANTMFLLKKLHENNFEAKHIVEMTIVNLVFTTEVPLTLNLDALAMYLMNVEYDPEAFPGLIYRARGIRAVILVYSNGKLVIVGTIVREQAEQILNEFMKEMREMMATL